MSGSVKGIIVEIGGDTSGLKSALSSVNTQTSSLSKELKSVNSLLKLDPSDIEMTTQKEELLTEAIEATENKLETLKQIQSEADEAIANGADVSDENYRALQRQIKSTEEYLENLKSQASDWTSAATAITNFGTNIEKLGDKISKVGNKLSILSTAVLALGTYAVSSSIEFESAFAGVEKTVDGTEEQLAELKQGIKDLAEEVPATTTEIAEVAEAAGQLGIATEDILEFTEVMIDLGESTNLEATEAASALAKLANITGTAAEDYSRMGSVIVALGNNFATTEADIVDMTTNLAASGELAGLTEPQMFALATAMSSVGIEAAAGGTSMSKLLRSIQTAVETGSEDLTSFASVAGMTADEFSQAFEEDAVEALYAFIDGLNDTERNGKSATVILEDMGITETRLTNTILSLANSSDVLGDAIETANTAWDENTALTEEAEKRYSTTESQIDMLKSKFSNLVTELGDALIPVVEDVMNVAEDLIDKFSDMTTEEKENIIQIGLLVVAIGPLTKVIGTLTSAAGSLVKGLGSVISKVGELTGNIKATSTITSTLASVLSSTNVQVALLTAGVAAAVAVVSYLTSEEREYVKASKETKAAVENTNEELQEATNSMNEYRQSLDDTTNSELSQLDNVQDLSNELQTLVDENGRVKEGYEKRVNYILNELNNALGTEYSLNDGIISQYDELVDSIDDVINKQRAQTLLENEYEKYTEAIENVDEAYKAMISAQEDEEEISNKLIEAKEKLNNLNRDDYDSLADYLSAYNGLTTEVENYANALGTAKENTELATNTYETYLEDIANYENDYTTVMSGTNEEIETMLAVRNGTYKAASETSAKTILDNMQQVETELEYYKTAYEEDLERNNDYEAEKNRIQKEAAETQLKTLADELVAMTSTVDELSDSQIEAWTYLAENAYDVYDEKLSQMDEATRNKINEATNIIAGDDSLEAAASRLAQDSTNSYEENLLLSNSTSNVLNLTKELLKTGELSGLAKENARNMTEAYDENLNIDEATLEEITSTRTAISGDTSVYEAMEVLGEDATNGFSNSVDGYTWGIDLTGGIASGIISGLSNVVSAATTVASGIKSRLGFSLPDEGPLSDFDTSMPDMIDLMVEGIESSKSKLVASIQSLANEMNTSLIDTNKIESALSGVTTQVVESTRNIFTTPTITFNVQKMNDENLESCFNYINRKFGSKY